MQVINQSWEWVSEPIDALKRIELAGRVCYKSEGKITDDSAIKFCMSLLGRQHESVLEHVGASVRFITDRGVTHELVRHRLVRHRLASFSQESTRYVNYSRKDMQFILPVWWEDSSEAQQNLWVVQMGLAEKAYNSMIELGSSPQEARSVLPNSLKTEIIVTANLREWRHIFKLRCSKAAHPQMRDLMVSCLHGFQESIPVLFEGLE